MYSFTRKMIIRAHVYQVIHLTDTCRCIHVHMVLMAYNIRAWMMSRSVSAHGPSCAGDVGPGGAVVEDGEVVLA